MMKPTQKLTRALAEAAAHLRLCETHSTDSATYARAYSDYRRAADAYLEAVGDATLRGAPKTPPRTRRAGR